MCKVTAAHDELDAAHIRECSECAAARWKRVEDFATAWMAENIGVPPGTRCETIRPSALRPRKVA